MNSTVTYNPDTSSNPLPMIDVERKKMKKSKVIQMVHSGTWQSKFGLMNRFSIKMENNDAGEYSSSKYTTIADQGFPFKIGAEVEYEFEEGKYPKIKPIKLSFGGFGGSQNRDPRSEKGMNKRTALMQAVEIAKHFSVSTVVPISLDPCEDILRNADMLYQWLENNMPEKRKENFSDADEDIRPDEKPTSANIVMKPCPDCESAGRGGMLSIKVGKKEGSFKGKRFWGCDRFPACRFFKVYNENPDGGAPHGDISDARTMEDSQS